jgi:CDP-glycerol glycerophosphotransferase (TagB/SpsB family)
MSASELGRDAFAALAEILQGLIGWLVIAPICALVPKRRDWIAVIGREDGKFIDNTKYFFIDAATDPDRHLRVVHVSERADVVATIREAGLESLRYPSTSAIWFLVRGGTAVVDSIEWYMKWRRFLLVRARLVQLWHGVGFKRIELDKWRNEASQRGVVSSKWLLWPRLFRRYVSGRVPKYDAVVTTSAFYRDNVFSKAFRSRHVLTTGYPRNGLSRKHPLAWANVDSAAHERLEEWKATKRKLVLVAPTFRDTRVTPLGLDAECMALLDAFCEQHGFEFIFKFHPYERGASAIYGRHLHVLDPCSDVYPLLPDIDFMVTDYSSIYMDFLLLDRPILFLTPDLQQYISRDRDIQFDFESMTPGPKFKSLDELLQSLLYPEPPAWRKKRQVLKLLTFDGNDQSLSTKRLLEFAENRQFILRPSRRTADLRQR